MKTAIFAIAALVVAAVAQDQSSLPQCAQLCAGNMLAASKANELGCNANDYKCLCMNRNFMYGLRDCTIAVCNHNMDEVSDIIKYGQALCAKNGVDISAVGGAPVSTTATASMTTASTAPSMSTIYSTYTTGGKTLTTAIATTSMAVSSGALESKSMTASNDVTPAGVVTTMTSDGSRIVRTLSTRVSAIASAAASDISSASSAASAAANSASSSSIKATGKASSSHAASSTKSGAAMPKKTAPPAGILAAAGIAAILL